MNDRRQAGFSLTELLISIAVASILLAAISTYFAYQNRSYAAQNQLTEMNENTRAALDLLEREIRLAGYNPTRATFNGIPYNASSATLDLYQDLDGDGAITGTNEHITYTYNSTQKILYRNANDGNGAQPLLDNLNAFQFSYLNGAGSVTTTSTEIRSVGIVLTMQASQPDRSWMQNNGYRTLTLNSSINAKNLTYK
jgi:type IV pilus assembly protein PilW